MRKKRKIPQVLSVLMAGALAASAGTAGGSAVSAAPATQKAGFADLSGITGNPLESIQRAVELGLFDGAADAFRPKDPLTRVEMAVLLTHALELPLGASSSSFKDVSASGWGSPYIEAIRKAGIVQGDGEGNYRPQAPVTRQEMAAMLMRAAELSPESGSESVLPGDWDRTAPWAQSYVRASLEQGSMKLAGGSFLPAGTVSRGEAAEMLLATFFSVEHDMILQEIRDSRHIKLNGVVYELSEETAALFTEKNKPVLSKAKLKFHANGRKIDAIRSLELRASGSPAGDGEEEFSRNLVLDGNGAVLPGDLIVSNDYLSVTGLQINGDLTVAKGLENDFYAEGIKVKGQTRVAGGDDNTVVFENSELNGVTVLKENVRIVASGKTVVQQMDIRSSAQVEVGVEARVPELTLSDGSAKVDLHGSLGQVTVQSSQHAQITGSASIRQLNVTGSGSVSIEGTGTIEQLQVSNAASQVAIGPSAQVTSVSLGQGVSPSAVTTSSAPVGGAGGSSSSGSSNGAPVQTVPFPDYIFMERGTPASIDLAAFFTDPDGDTLKMSAISSSNRVAGVSMSGYKATLTPAASGTATIKVSIDDQHGNKISASIKVTVYALPVAQTVPDQLVQLNGAAGVVKLSDYFSDKALRNLTYSVSSSDTSVADVSVNGDELSLTPLRSGHTSVTVTAQNDIVAHDGSRGETSVTFKLTVNTPPAASQNPADVHLAPGAVNSPLDLSQLFTDGDGDTLIYEAESGDPSVATGSVQSGLLTIQANQPGTAVIKLRAKDGKGGVGSADLTVHVGSFNQSPVVSLQPADRLLAVGQTDTALDLAQVFADPDQDTLVYEYTVSDPSVVAAVRQGDSLLLTALQGGQAVIKLTAKDGKGGEVSASFTVTVNRAPEAVRNPDDVYLVAGRADGELDLSQFFADGDQDPLTYEVQSSVPGTASWEVAGQKLKLHALQVGTSAFRVTAKDGRGGEAAVTFTVNVRMPNTLGTIPDQTVELGAPKLLDLTALLAGFDAAATVTADTYDTSVATVLLSDRKLTMTPVSEGTATVTLSVYHPVEGDQSTQFAIRVVQHLNSAPTVVKNIPDQLLTPGVTNVRTFDLASYFADADGDALSYTVSGFSPAVVSAAVSGSILTLNPGTGSADGQVTVTADDGKGGTAEFRINVRTAQLINNEIVTVRTKQGIKDPLTYDLAELFPGETSFRLYKGTPDAIISGPTVLNGKAVALANETSYLWVIGAQGKAAVFRVVAEAQGAPQIFFSEYLDAGNGEVAIELFYSGDMDPSKKPTGYSLEVHQYMKKTGKMNVFSNALFDQGPGKPLINPYIFIDSTFYTFFDKTMATYFNDDGIRFYNPLELNTVALVLKKDGQVVDVLGDPSSTAQFLPDGGTLVRKSGVSTGSQQFSRYGEWNVYPKGSYQFMGHHTP
ncbi:S-layer homology domain-containing protein [Paenibacillus sp. GbtcB18]|uniref:S-layer homology domain-containing protein n=1 Tax=Paenibacillus sp. GbtcB18 TaxID=2824763 RepID=UPI001C30265B|nr:S-layer homology domain-containing protein [Paenibacillus sp. GbtcB18]